MTRVRERISVSVPERFDAKSVVIPTTVRSVFDGMRTEIPRIERLLSDDRVSADQRRDLGFELRCIKRALKQDPDEVIRAVMKIAERVSKMRFGPPRYESEVLDDYLVG